ncbi:hypothetical protein E8E13_003690 [Curvularia kusanoi]|uniref:NAD-dependent epimerase/dehydratase domain-containing protein n=1 Tax=Curvularia kusanoi TaxID=90978 RepID=A0A9P4T4G8_CURKU|nr:hypothetical protein E8E13_003690 [Curvularia kusanoi]
MSSFRYHTIDPGSTVLVTGANGFVGAHIADQLLQKGYKVRGTVRDFSKHRWLVDLMSRKYGSDNFDLVTVKDMKIPGAFDEAVSGVSGIIHVASPRSVHITPQELIETTVAGTLSCLEAAVKERSVKRFVLTSSSSAVRSLQAYRRSDTVSANEYDEETLGLAEKIPADLPVMQKFMIAYFASKVAAEKAFWKWVTTHQPHFTVNTVLPCTIYGSPLEVSHQGFPSTSRIPLQILDGDTDSIKHVQRFYYVHVQDVARLHFAALVDPFTSNERIFAFAGPYCMNELFDIFSKVVPGYKAPAKIAGLDFPLAEIGPQRKAKELLQDLGRKDFVELEETMIDMR